jgi:hypothetical protein
MSLTINGELNGICIFGASSSSSEATIDFTVLIHITWIQITNNGNISVQQNNLYTVGKTCPYMLLREAIGGLLNASLPTRGFVDVRGARIRSAVPSDQLAVIL